MIGLLVCAVLGILAGPIFNIWLGRGYSISIRIMPWIAVALVFLACQLPVASLLIALGKYRIPSILAPIIAVCNLIAVLILVGWCKLGLGAVAITMFACNFIRLGLFQTWYAARQCRTSLPTYLLNGYLRPFLSFLPCIILLLLSKEFLHHWSLPRLIIIVTTVLLVYIPSCWFIAFDSWDKSLVKSYSASLKARFARR